MRLCRRNLTPDQFKLLLGRKYNRVKGKQGGTGANQYSEQSGQFDLSANTAETLAQQHGVSEKTVRRAGELAEAIDENAIPEFEALPFFEAEAKKRQVEATIAGNKSRHLDSPVSQLIEQPTEKDSNQNKSINQAASATGTIRMPVKQLIN